MLRKFGIFVSIACTAAITTVGIQAHSSNFDQLKSELPSSYVQSAVYVEPIWAQPQRPVSRPQATPVYNAEDLECMAMNIFFEAGIESYEGKVAVGRVTLNRVHDSRFPSTVCDVVRQARTDSRGNPIRNRCQFSWYCDGKPDDVPVNSRNYQESLSVAMEILDGMHDGFVDYATHYHADYVSPRWRHDLTLIANVDTHIFYRWD